MLTSPRWGLAPLGRAPSPRPCPECQALPGPHLPHPGLIRVCWPLGQRCRRPVGPKPGPVGLRSRFPERERARWGRGDGAVGVMTRVSKGPRFLQGPHYRVAAAGGGGGAHLLCGRGLGLCACVWFECSCVCVGPCVGFAQVCSRVHTQRVWVLHRYVHMVLRVHVRVSLGLGQRAPARPHHSGSFA